MLYSNSLLVYAGNSHQTRVCPSLVRLSVYSFRKHFQLVQIPTSDGGISPGRLIFLQHFIDTTLYLSVGDAITTSYHFYVK
jgi:hypothetical protein